MNDWYTILTFTYPQEAYLPKAKLEDEGIMVMINNELTAQVINIYSNAVGGVKLQVQETDIDRALKILKELGYIEESEQSENKFLQKIDELSSRLPIIGKSILAIRLFVLVTLFLIISAGLIYVFTLPSLSKKLTQNAWVLHSLTFKGKEIRTYGNGIDFTNISSSGLKEQGMVDLPSFNNNGTNANWKLEDGKLTIFNSDTLSEIYNGKYTVEISNNYLTIQSQYTTIVGHKSEGAR